MFCEVVLSQKFPKSMGIFDYEVPNNFVHDLKLGQLVKIPFRQSEKEGVIIKIKKKSIPGKKIKNITEIIDKQPIITNRQIQLAEWLSNYYFVSPGTVIKTMLPPIPKKKRELKINYQASGNALKNINSKKLLINKKNCYYVHNSDADRLSMISDICSQTKNQILIITPTLFDIDTILKNIDKKLNDKIAVINNTLNKTQYYDAWQRIINNKAKIIIGTKLALFSPFAKLETIILDQTSNQNHKQSDQNPRYHSWQIIDQLNNLYKTKTIFLNPALTVRHYQLYKKEQIDLLQNKRDAQKATIVDMRQEQMKKNFSIFSDELIIDMNDALEKNDKVFLFINKRGSNSSVICRDCGQSLICDNCRQPLTFHDADETLYCHHCNKKFELPPFCPNCHGPNFKFIGTGTQKVEQEIIRLFADKQITRLDQDSPDIKKSNNAHIIIGTELALPHLDWDKISLVGVISADTYLYLPDYNSAERTWQLLNKILDLAKHNVIIQTYNKENNVIKYLPDQDTKFFKQELKTRQEMNYPPYTEFIKLIYSDHDKKECLLKIETLYKKLTKETNNVSIITPLAPFHQGKWRMYIIIKLENKSDLEKFKSVAKFIPDDWTIDRNPYTLL